SRRSGEASSATRAGCPSSRRGRRREVGRGLGRERVELMEGCFAVLAMVVAQKSGGERVRKAKRTDRFRLDGALRALGVHDDGDDFDRLWRIEFFEDVFGVSHLCFFFKQKTAYEIGQ